MNYPIKIHDYSDRKIINARELHAFLGSKYQFTDWIKIRIKRLNLIEFEHYWVFQFKLKNSDGQAGRSQLSYGLTINAAERIAIEENNEQTKYGICSYPRYS